MLTVASQTRIFIALRATDMRKGFDGLSGLVFDTLKQDPLSGAFSLCQSAVGSHEGSVLGWRWARYLVSSLGARYLSNSLIQRPTQCHRDPNQ